jgi:hypothetical protein
MRPDAIAVIALGAAGFLTLMLHIYSDPIMAVIVFGVSGILGVWAGRNLRG